MSVLVYLVPMALALGLAGLAAFVWSLRSGQYEDMDGDAARILSDDDIARSLAAERQRHDADLGIARIGRDAEAQLPAHRDHR